MNIVEEEGTFRGSGHKWSKSEDAAFYYFYPEYRWISTPAPGHWKTLSVLDLEMLLPDSDHQRIWFPKAFGTEQEYLDKLDDFVQGEMCLKVKKGDVIFEDGKYKIRQKKWQEKIKNGGLKKYDPNEALPQEEAPAPAESLDAEAALPQEEEPTQTEGLNAEAERLEAEIKALNEAKEELEKKRQELQAEDERLEAEIKALNEAKDALEKKLQARQAENERLEQEKAAIEAYFQEALTNPLAKLCAITGDEQLSLWLQQTLAGPQKTQEPSCSHLPFRKDGSGDLAAELCACVQKFRPQYSSLDILNIAVCLTQGFLTVFFGAPGCGKTSICNIFAHVLGLRAQNRYVPVSVERGWMSKRDFIGCFNPLTRTFDSSNRMVYDTLRLLHGEPACLPSPQDPADSLCPRPFLILLDEANLSAMEYYWADFMNLCEDSLIEGRLRQGDGTLREIRGTVNLGEEELEVPDWLRFTATINVDHTTETLSPRLIDRAWLVSLPKAADEQVLDLRQLERECPPLSVAWPAMQEAFGPGDSGRWEGSGAQKAFQEVVERLQGPCRTSVSHRVWKAVRRYWSGASRVFQTAWPEDAPYKTPETAALDYAVAQRALPQLQGSGMDFAKELEELKKLCGRHGLQKSAAVVQRILEQGAETEYFQFF